MKTVKIMKDRGYTSLEQPVEASMKVADGRLVCVETGEPVLLPEKFNGHKVIVCTEKVWNEFARNTLLLKNLGA